MLLLSAAEHSWTFDSFALHDATNGHPLSCLAFFLLHRINLVRHKILLLAAAAEGGAPLLLHVLRCMINYWAREHSHLHGHDHGSLLVYLLTKHMGCVLCRCQQ